MPNVRPARTYGWIPDLPDIRDHYLRIDRPTLPLPDQVDLEGGLPAVFDQGSLGSCTGNGLAATVYYDRQALGEVRVFIPSRLFIYYQERVIEDSIAQDAGAMIRDGIKALAEWGVCSEITWPYVISEFAQRPPTGAYVEAAEYEITSYARVPQAIDAGIRQCLAQKWPIVFGFTVYESFESQQVAATGIMPMPGANEGVLGGHCVVACGYDHDRRLIKCRNSWGLAWGDRGNFWMPYDYIGNPELADDLWQITGAK